MGSQSRPYAGPDRRQRTFAHLAPPTGQTMTIVVAMALLGGLVVPLAVARALTPSSTATAFVVLRVLAALIITSAGVMNLIRWRMTGEATLAMLGSAVVLYGTVGVLPALLRLSLPNGFIPYARAVSGLVVVFILVCALLAPAVSTGVRPARLITVGLMTSLLGDALLYRYVGSHEALMDGHLPAELGVAMTGLWAVLAIASFIRGRMRQQPRWVWLGVAAITVAFTEAARAAALHDPQRWLLSSGCLQLAAGVVWALSAGQEMLAVLSDQGNNLMTLNDRLSLVSARLDETRARDEERVHDARAALCAVQSAVATMTRYYEKLEEESRSGLERAVDSELGRLRHLLDNVRAADLVHFDLARAIEPVIVAQRTHGMKIDLQVGSFCWVRGRPADTATVVQTLLENARRYAPDSPVTVRISRSDGQVVLAVEDQGPGIPTSQREQIFSRGGRGEGTRNIPGSGLGLFIAQRLMTDQLGAIGVHDGLTGGACFVLTFVEPGEFRTAAATRPARRLVAVADDDAADAAAVTA